MTITVHWRWSYHLKHDLKYGHTPQADTPRQRTVESRLYWVLGYLSPLRYAVMWLELSDEAVFCKPLVAIK